MTTHLTKAQKASAESYLFGEVLTLRVTAETTQDIFAASTVTGDVWDFHGRGLKHDHAGHVTAGTVTSVDIHSAAGVELMHIAGTFNAPALYHAIGDAQSGVSSMELTNLVHGHDVTVTNALSHLGHLTDFVL